MIEQVPYCDGCGAKMTGQECQTSFDMITRMHQENPAACGIQSLLANQKVVLQIPMEIFCSACLPHGVSYWVDKMVVIREILDEGERRVIKHRRTFFDSKRSVRKDRKPAKLVVVPEISNEAKAAAGPS